MKTSVLQHLLEQARRTRRRPPDSIFESRFAIAVLLIFALTWSLVLPFSTYAKRIEDRPQPNAPASTESSISTQTTETFNVYGPQRFTRLPGQPVNTVQTF